MRLLILSIICLCTLHLSAQKKGKEFFVLYDANWKICKERDAAYMAYVEKINDTTWQWNHYNLLGPLINVETYRDENATIPNGYFAYYNKNGKIDSCGFTYYSKKIGTWYYFGDSTQPQHFREYNMGILVSEKSKNDKDAPIQYSKLDREAEYVDGKDGWKKYLTKNIRFPQRAINYKIKGTVLVAFTVDTDGKIGQMYLTRSIEYSLDKEAIYLIRNSKDWIPAMRNGVKVKAYRLQPITFAF